MSAQGFSYKKEEYATVLKFLETLGVGILKKNHKGKILGLSGIKLTLKSLGTAAFGNSHLDNYHVKNRFGNLPAPKPRSFKVERPVLVKPLSISFEHNGKQIKLPIPMDLSNSDIADLITKLR